MGKRSNVNGPARGCGEMPNRSKVGLGAPPKKKDFLRKIKSPAVGRGRELRVLENLESVFV